jgi:transposase
VFHYFRLWQTDGTWGKLHDRLRADVRRAAGKKPKPSAAIVDSQSVKTTEVAGPRGADAGKKGRRPQAVRGR